MPDARTTDVTGPTTLAVAPASAGAPYEWVEFRSIHATVGMWVNVHGGEVADGGNGSVFFAAREPCRLRQSATIRVMAESGTVRVNAVSYTPGDVETD